MPSLVTRLLPLPIVVLLAALTAFAIIKLYSRDRLRLPPPSARLLVGLRLTAGVLLVLLAADPACVARRTVDELARLLVAVDISRSSDLREPSRPAVQVDAEAKTLGATPDEIRSASRRELAARLLAGRWLDDLKRRFDVTVLALSTSLQPFAETLPPASGGTDLLGPIADHLASARDRTLAGVILLTDGHDHGPGDPRERIERLRRLTTPVVSVAIGATEPIQDLAVEAVDATGVFFAGDEIKAQVAIAATNVEALATEIVVLEGDTPLVSLPIRLAPGSSRTAWPLSFPAGSPGRKKLTVRVAKATGEEFDGNNSRDLWLDVLSTKAKVLLLDGTPRWEQRYLRATWARETSIELASFLVTPPPERRLPAEFPRSREALFAFDVIVFGDLEPGLFARNEVALLHDFVRARGGTLVLIAGERAMPYRWNETPLAELLPVQLLEPPPPVGTGQLPDAGDGKFRLTALGEAAAVTRLVPGREANVELWRLLAGPRWICPSLGAKPGAEVLVTVNEAPVLLTRAFGGGRVFFAGIDCTWKWRYKFGDELHRRFWGQVIRWAVSRQLTATDDRVQLGTNAALYSPTSPIQIEALLRPTSAGSGEAIVDAVLERVSDGKQSRLRLTPIPQSGGRFSGATALDEIALEPELGRATEYRVWIESPALDNYTARADRAQARFVVEPDADLEARDLGTNTAFLDEVAAATGGAVLTLSRASDARAHLKESTRRVESTIETSPLSWPITSALALLGLLAAEWAFRKRRELL